VKIPRSCNFGTTSILVTIVILLGGELGLGQAGEEATEDPRLSLCYSEGGGEFLSLEPSGLLILLSRSPEGSALNARGAVEVKALQLSVGEMDLLEAEVRKVVENYKPLLHSLDSEVISISDDAEEPRGFAVEDGMAAVRFWLEGETWEFYTSREREGPGDGGLGTISEKLREFGRRSTSEYARGNIDGVLVIIEKPRHFFIPHLHEAVVGAERNKYLRWDKTGLLPLEFEEFGEILARPGTVNVVDQDAWQRLQGTPQIQDRDQFLKDLISKGIIQSEPVTTRDLEVFREKIHYTITAIPTQPQPSR